MCIDTGVKLKEIGLCHPCICSKYYKTSLSCASGYCRVLKSANPCVKLVGLMEDKGSELKDPKWTGDAVLKFLQSPVYSVPLLDFIDDNCSVFKDCNESNLECTIVRSNYMRYIVKPL